MTTPITYKLTLSFNGDSIATVPEQIEATTCKTHQEVLAYLEKIKSSGSAPTIHFYHNDGPTLSHPCPLQDQIDFVLRRIEMQTRNQPQSSLWSWVCIVQ